MRLDRNIRLLSVGALVYGVGLHGRRCARLQQLFSQLIGGGACCFVSGEEIVLHELGEGLLYEEEGGAQRFGQSIRVGRDGAGEVLQDLLAQAI